MATKIINRSDATMEVLVGTSSGDRIIRLEPGQQNNALVTPKALKPASSSDQLMGSNEWLEIMTDVAVVYGWGGGLSAFSSKASLHCVPFTPMGSGPYNPGYRKVTEPNAQEQVDPQPVEEAAPADAADGEFDMPELFFGKYVRTKVGTATYITIRLNLRRLSISDAQLNNIKPVWKDEIETVWNNSPTSSSNQTYQFEVDWTDRIAHSSVFVSETSDRPSMFTWSLDMGTGKLVSHVAAHEFGHHIGLSDGYHYQGEIPDLTEEMARRTARYRNKTITPTFATYVWYLFGLNPVTSDRAAERIRNKLLPNPANLMTGSTRFGPLAKSSHSTPYKNDPMRNGISAVSLIDVELIDAIENQQLQPLYLDEVDFVAHESYSDEKLSTDGYFSKGNAK